MTVSRNLRRPAAAVAAVAAFATVLTACSSSDDDAASTGAAQSTAASSETAANETGAVDGLDAAQAQVIIRTAVNADTSIDELSKVLDTSTPGVAQAMNGFAKGASKAGYTPDVYTVKSVKADGENKAIAVTAVKSPHTPQPVDINLALVNKDDNWLLSPAAVTTLTSMGR
ncbi:hypothetical protein [Gordonia sp. (in: high G+C Gram-positive bacteria)]|uniref:hypothetical protein n=1 Tax=Gordonia sp. (in: high G+C Gram-positive bacteria) TaxID=84139 RepID=UPI00169CB683|nr:hypothetical protein [Gordonia sp. (in: high G+C Gram-positive bacteria)]NLG48302.1 hypothetical protein [Gordonia sp. (in: high G+C Gram-positive bacteria)]